MSARSHALIAKKACTRCRTQKRRCDRAIPDCGLCTRLHQRCKYELPRISSMGPTLSPLSEPGIFFGLGAFTPSHIKDSIVQKLGSFTPQDALSAYCRALEPWFPIISVSRLRTRLPLTWNEAPLDVALLCQSIILFTASRPSSPECGDDASEFKSLYLHSKSCMTIAEGLGINSFLMIQSRILVILFELAHGFHLSAYISIGATVRAADLLQIQPGINTSRPYSVDDVANQERALTWCGILIVDRYTAIESGPHPSLTHSRSQIFHDVLKPVLCPTHQHGQDRSSPICRLSRLFEASALLDKIHITLNNPTAEQVFNMEELFLTIQTITNLQTILNEEIGSGFHLYAGGWGLCNIALLLAFENGSKVPLIAGVTENCNSVATTSLVSVLSTISSAIEPFTLGTHTIDFNILPPFVTFLIYKAAAIVTERLLMDSDSDEGLKRLKLLRSFLMLAGERWLGCEHYLKLLDEDTTPRIQKAINYH